VVCGVQNSCTLYFGERRHSRELCGNANYIETDCCSVVSKNMTVASNRPPTTLRPDTRPADAACRVHENGFLAGDLGAIESCVGPNADNSVSNVIATFPGVFRTPLRQVHTSTVMHQMNQLSVWSGRPDVRRGLGQ
jgi:hypothetical protein